jgi:hypothetical protein
MNGRCGCCEGLSAITPAKIINPPGLAALAYRVGTHASFLATMEAAISAPPGAPPNPLAPLMTRERSDFSIALLDAWATVADVLTFYQERIANEGYLRTATERRSVEELARLIGYSLRPGVSASVFLAYTLEKDSAATLEVGNRSQSIPGPGEQAQSFETAEKLEARFAWNTLELKMTRPQIIPRRMKDGHRVLFDGIATKLKPNDPILFGGGAGAVYRVGTVTPDAAAKRTSVTVLSWSESTELPARLEEARAVLDAYTSANPPPDADHAASQPVFDLLAKLVRELRDDLANAETLTDFQERISAGISKLILVDRSTLENPWAKDAAILLARLASVLGSTTAPSTTRARIEATQEAVDAGLVTFSLPIPTSAGVADALTGAKTGVKDRLLALKTGLDTSNDARLLEGTAQDLVDALGVALPLLPSGGRGALWTDRLTALLGAVSSFVTGPRRDALKTIATGLEPIDVSGVSQATKDAVGRMKTAMNAVTTLPDGVDPAAFAAGVQHAVDVLNIESLTLAASNETPPAQVNSTIDSLSSLIRDLPASALIGAVSSIVADYGDPANVLNPPPTLTAPEQAQVDRIAAVFRADDLAPGLGIDDLRNYLANTTFKDLVAELVDAPATREELRRWARDYRDAVSTFADGLGAAPLRQKLREIVARYQDEDGPGLTPDTEIVLRAFTYLGQLDNDLGSGVSDQVQDQLAKQTIGRLRTELVIADAGGYPRVEPWLNGLIAELDDAVQALSASASPSSPEPPKRGTTDGSVPSTDDGLARDPSDALKSDLIAKLLTAPAALPPNELRLRREPGDLTAGSNKTLASSDIVPQLLVNLEPRLASVLYPALSNAEVNPSTAPGTAYALRVKAAPFGVGAGLRPILGTGDQKNVIVDHDEWPLLETTLAVTLRDIPRDTNLAAVPVEVVVGKDDIESRATFASISAITGELGDFRIEAETVAGPPKQVEIRFFLLGAASKKPDRQISVEFAATNASFSITLDGQTWPVRLGESRTMRTSDGRAQLEARAITGGNADLIISESAPGPRAKAQMSVLTLDAIYDQISPGSWVVIDRGGTPAGALREVYVRQVRTVKTVARALYNLSAKVTELTLDGDWLTDADRTLGDVRETSIFAQSEPLRLTDAPYDADLLKGTADTIELDGLLDGLKSGRWVIISGERTDVPATKGIRAAELAMIRDVRQDVVSGLDGDRLHSFLTLSVPLANSYKRSSVTIYGNVVRATHGETRSEVLGSGNASSPSQEFSLRQQPLTYVSAANPRGIASTLQLRVDGVLWNEALTFAPLGPTDRNYVLRHDEGRGTVVAFGDGKHGARLPSGSENVQAVYRQGIGKPGNVDEEKISLLSTRPLGVKGVINPLPATGGADPESLDDARSNAPLGITALDRLVSLEDYADFTRTFAGIGKATAERLPGSQGSIVHLTIAGADDIPITANSDLLRNLRQALHTSGDPFQGIRVEVRERVVIILSVRIRIVDGYLWENVVQAVRAALLLAFGFNQRELGEDVYLAEVYRVIQAVEGVWYSDVRVFGGIPEHDDSGNLARPQDVLKRLQDIVSPTDPSARPGVVRVPEVVKVESTRYDPATRRARPAQIAVLLSSVPDTLILNEITP